MRKLPPDVSPAPHPEEWIWLGLATAVLVASCLLTITDTGLVAPRGYPEYALPPTCNSVRLFGIRCPGCGLTRSFVSMAHGDFMRAFSYHKLGWFGFLLVAAQIPYRLLRIYAPSRDPLTHAASRAFVYLLVVGLLLTWVITGLTEGFGAR